jgi:hypothetical protein
MQRVVVTLGAVALMLGITIGPAAAADANVSVSWDGVNGSALSTSATTATINSGEAVVVSYSTTDVNSDHLEIYTGGCGTGVPVLVPPGGSTSLTPSSSTIYSMFAIAPGLSLQSACAQLDVTVSSAPPPDVPEAPLAAGLLGTAVVVLGGGFFFARRRRARVA